MDDRDVHMTTKLFNTREDAEKAYNDAIDAGYISTDINVMMSDASRDKYYNSVLVKEGTKAGTGAGVGGATGAAIGGIAAAVAAIGTSLVIPGLNLVVAGPIAAGLAGIGAGAMTGGVVGACVGWGIPEDKAKVIATGIESGGIVLGVNDNRPGANLENRWNSY